MLTTAGSSTVVITGRRPPSGDTPRHRDVEYPRSSAAQERAFTVISRRGATCWLVVSDSPVVLPYTGEIGRVWGRVSAECEAKGQPIPLNEHGSPRAA